MPKIPGEFRTVSGNRDYTHAGLASCDLESARLAINRTLDIPRAVPLTKTQRMDFLVALRHVERAARRIDKHVVFPAEIPLPPDPKAKGGD